jgi:hypothetical protein
VKLSYLPVIRSQEGHDMNRALFTAPMAMLVSAGFLFAAAGPAAASDDACAVQPSELRAAASTVDNDAARQALRNVVIGEKLCEAGNERAAAKKFAAAGRVLQGAGAAEFADAAR